MPDSTFSSLNVATGQPHSLLQLLDTLESIAGQKVEWKFAAARAGDIRHSVASSEKLQGFGWTPSIDFKEGLTRLVQSV